ncbi:MAG TPA: hypothetical protein VFS75_00520 [Candidatus Paceibacterota bacterium]|nr:hypothetical protein [Candidatus Paceibacterota bacterium]
MQRERRTFGKRATARRGSNFARQLVFGGLLLVTLGLLGSGVWYATRLPALTIAAVEVDGGETISHDTVRTRVENVLSGSYVLLVPKRFSYLYPHDAIVASLSAVPRVHDVSVERTSRNELAVSFDEYVPHALWCASGASSTPCWFIDDTGYAFSAAPDLRGGTLVRHLDENATDVHEGQVIDAAKLAAVDRFISRAERELHFRITALTYRKDGDVEFSVNGGGMILASADKDLDAAFDNLKTVLESPKFSHLAPGTFKYVDVRLESKIFVNETTDTDEKLPE